MNRSIRSTIRDGARGDVPHLRDERCFVRVGEISGGEIAGYTVSEIQERSASLFSHQQSVLYLAQIVVAPQQRKRGVGADTNPCRRNPQTKRYGGPMRQQIVHVALVVHDYDEAIRFYTEKLGFQLIADTPIPEQNKRWVLVAPPGDGAEIGS